MKKLIASITLCAVLFVMLVVPAQAERMGGNNGADNTNGMNSYRANATGMNDDDNTDWGWLGLIGLVGLAGLMGRNRERSGPQR